MPAWLRCRECGSKFYTARSDHKLGEEECDYCGGEMDKICKNVSALLEEGLTLRFSPENGEEYQGHIHSLTEDSITIVFAEDLYPEKISSGNKLTFKFYHNKKEYQGRYKFKSKVIKYHKGYLSVTIPLYIIHIQERDSRRVPLHSNVYYLFTDKENSKLHQGKSVDISLSGLLLADDKEKIEEVEKNTKLNLKLEVADQTIYVEGRVARIDELDEGKNQAGIGIEFSKMENEVKEKINEYKLQHMI